MICAYTETSCSGAAPHERGVPHMTLDVRVSAAEYADTRKMRAARYTDSKEEEEMRVDTARSAEARQARTHEHCLAQQTQTRKTQKKSGVQTCVGA